MQAYITADQSTSFSAIQNNSLHAWDFERTAMYMHGGSLSPAIQTHPTHQRSVCRWAQPLINKIVRSELQLDVHVYCTIFWTPCSGWEQ